MNKLTNILLALLIVAAASSCKTKSVTASDSDMQAQGYVKAMVVEMNLDGCGFMLELESDKSKLEPDGLQPEFQKDSVPVWIKYKSVERMSVCMAGATIDLLAIKKR